MSIYSYTHNSFKTPKMSNYSSFKNLTKFNSFFLSKKNNSRKGNQINPLSNKKYNNRNSLMSTNYTTPFKITNIENITNTSSSKNLNITNSKSYKNFLNKSYFTSPKAKNKYSTDILNTQLTKKFKKRRKIDIPKFNTFLGKKIIKRPLNLNIFDYINGYNLKITSNLINKTFIHKNINDIQIKKKLYSKGNNSISESMKLLINRKNKSWKNRVKDLFRFKQRLRSDKRDNMHEYNEFILSLRTTLNRSKSISNTRNYLFYD